VNHRNLSFIESNPIHSSMNAKMKLLLLWKIKIGMCNADTTVLYRYKWLTHRRFIIRLCHIPRKILHTCVRETTPCPPSKEQSNKLQNKHRTNVETTPTKFGNNPSL
jgi:hypothetical protein